MINAQKMMYLLYDAIYNVETMLPCNEYQCSDGCEPGHVSNIEVCLLPFEKEYIISKIDKRNYFDSIDYNKDNSVGLIKNGNICSYFCNDKCSIHKYRPIDCRSYPLIPTNITGELTFQLHSICKLDYYLSSLREHIRVWRDVWYKLYPYLDSDWWRLYNRYPKPIMKKIISIDDILIDFKTKKVSNINCIKI